jgi:HAD superfamily hydrolase (TIGR01509 family)
LEFKVRLPNGRSETRRVELDRQGRLLAFFEKAFAVKFRDHELGPQFEEVEGQRSSYYHFAFVDRRTGRRYLPYAEAKGGTKVYLDLRHIIATKEFAQNMAVEVFLVFDHREPEGTLATRYDGVHASFRLDEFTSAELRMADIGRMMRKYYIGNAGEDYRFHFLQLRARMLGEEGMRRWMPSPVFSFDGIAFSFSLPGAACEEVPSVGTWHASGAPEPVMVLESQPGLGGFSRELEKPQSAAATLARMPILAESLLADRQKLATPRVAADAAPGTLALPAQREGKRMAKRRKEGNAESSPWAKQPELEAGGRGRAGSERLARPVPFAALSSFKAVIFDLDGVIVDSETVHPRTFELALAEYGVKIDNRLWKRAYTGIGSYAIFDDLVKKYGIKEDARELVKKRNEIYLAEIKRNRLPVIAGFPEVHRLLSDAGIKEAVASGGHANHVKESLRSAGLEGMPFVAIEQVRRGKPAPEIFLLAAKRLGVKPSECIVFEDSLSGVEAAARAGMPCVALSTTMPAGELRARAALVARDFRSKRLKSLLAALLGKGARAKGKGGPRTRKTGPGGKRARPH